MVFVETAHELWAELEERFSQGNGPRIYEIRCTITNTRQEQLTVVAYFSKLKKAWDELKLLPYSPIMQLWGIEGDSMRAANRTYLSIPYGIE